jgi:hypothetical protein
VVAPEDGEIGGPWGGVARSTFERAFDELTTFLGSAACRRGWA